MSAHYRQRSEAQFALPGSLRQISTGAAVGLAIGAVTAYSAQYALMLAVVGVALATILRTWERITYAALFVCLAVPLGWNFAQVAHLNVHVTGVSIVLPVLLPVTVITLTFFAGRWAGGWLAVWESSPGYAMAWVALLGAFLIALLEGAQTNGSMVAARDAQYVVIYGWPLAVLPLARTALDHLAKRAFGVVLTGMAAFSITACAIFVLPTVRAKVYEGSIWATSIRVGFGNDSLLTLGIPLLAALLARRVISRRWRRLSWLGLFAMMVAVGLSQTRTDIVVVLATLTLMAAYSLVRRAPWSAGMIIRGVLVIVVVLGVVTGGLYLSGSGRVRTAVLEIPSRVASLANPTRDASWQTRVQTNRIAWSLWGESLHSRIVGLGMGTSMGVYNPAGVEVQNVSFVDNAWATAAVKGGLILVVALATYLAACWGVFIRAARRAVEETEKVAWLACALAFPGFLFASTYMSAHILTSPSVIIAVTTLATVAALAEPKQVHSGA